VVQFCGEKIHFVFYLLWAQWDVLHKIKLQLSNYDGISYVKASRPSACHEGLQGSGGIAPPILTLIFTRPSLSFGERATCVHSSWGWVDPRAGLDT